MPIICKKHGVFYQTPFNHITLKQGCRKCYEESVKGKTIVSKDYAIKICTDTHKGKYIYDNVIFQGVKNKMLNILCTKHGFFDQIAYDHMNGHGCPYCKFEKQTMTKEEFIEKSIIAHNGYYIYDKGKIQYINNHTKVPITCPKHGEFWQTPSYHLIGGGCPKCSSSKLEKELMLYFNENKIDYAHRKHFKWLGRMEVDFFLEKYNTAIECQGLQHFEEIKHFHRNANEFNDRLEKDKLKYKLCKEHGIKLLYYSNLGIVYPYKVFENKEELLKEIMGTV